MTEPQQSRQLVLAIHGRFASAILNGTKAYELRKRLPKGLSAGDRVYLYETAPTSAIVGAFTIAKVLKLSVPEAWQTVGAGLGITKEEFDSYVNGAGKVVALKVQERFRLRRQQSCQDLASLDAAFCPPRSAVVIENDALLAYLGELIEPVDENSDRAQDVSPGAKR